MFANRLSESLGEVLLNTMLLRLGGDETESLTKRGNKQGVYRSRRRQVWVDLRGKENGC